MSLLSPEVRAWLGREEVFEAPEAFSGAEFRYFALAVGDDNPRWQQGEAPPTFVCESSQYLRTRADLLAGGHHWDLPITGCRLLRGGHEYEFGRPLRAGDRLKVTWRITGFEEKTASTGADMLIVTSEATYQDQRGERLAVNRETLIYQALSG